MSKTLYTLEQDGKSLKAARIFYAPQALVWKAWTTPALLDQWWAPKPWKAATRSMDFREGGSWIYSMTGPGGEQHWSKADYHKIRPESYFSCDAYFIDPREEALTEMSPGQWEVSFREQQNETHVQITVSFRTKEQLRQFVDMGFREGFAAAHDNLDELLNKVSNRT